MRRKGRAARRLARQRKRLGFTPQAKRQGHGHRMGMTVSCRDHEVHRDRKKEANKRACRGRVVRED